MQHTAADHICVVCGAAAAVSAGADNRADGLLALGDAYARGETGTSPVELVVTVDRDTLASGAGTADCQGEPVSAETARRLACDAGVVEAVVGSHGNPLDIGRRSRTVPPAIRRALRLRDGGCTFPGCTNHRWVDAHHIEHWAEGGDTSLDNITTLCSSHHRLVHEQGYTVELAADGTAVFHDEHGRIVEARPSRLRGSADDLVDANRAAGLDIDPETNFPGWDGMTPDYHLCVAGLARRPRAP